MIQVLLPGQWCSFSDRELEHALTVCLDVMPSCGSSTLNYNPAHMAICRFRQLPVRCGLNGVLLPEVSHQLCERSLKGKPAPVKVTDVTVVKSVARPRRHCSRGRDAYDFRATLGGSKRPLVKERRMLLLRFQENSENCHPDSLGRGGHPLVPHRRWFNRRAVHQRWVAERTLGNPSAASERRGRNTWSVKAGGLS